MIRQGAGPAGVAAVTVVLCFLLGGCANIPLTEDGLAIGKNTTANIDDIGVGRVTNKF